MYNITIIGVGSLGKRHLESVLKSKFSTQIYIVDKNQDAIDEALKMNERIVGGRDFNILPPQIDLAIIATSSSERKSVFEELIRRSKIRYIIFEKVLFQQEYEYYEVNNMLQKYGIKAWVNCARREQKSYIELKKYIEKNNYFTFHMSGGAWGMGCNTIHMLDLIQYLSESSNLIIYKMNLLPRVEESKRKGYKEIYGSISGKCGKCLSFTITSYYNSNAPESLQIIGDNCHVQIYEREHKVLIKQSKDGWKNTELEFPLFYQSQQTQKVIEKIITEGDCNLPKYKESMELHLLFIKPLIDFFEKQGLEKGICPIT